MHRLACVPERSGGLGLRHCRRHYRCERGRSREYTNLQHLLHYDAECGPDSLDNDDHDLCFDDNLEFDHDLHVVHDDVSARNHHDDRTGDLGGGFLRRFR